MSDPIQYYKQYVKNSSIQIAAKLFQVNASLGMQTKEEAIKYYKTAKQLNPKDPMPNLHIGAIYLLYDYPEFAIRSFQQAIIINQKINEVHFSLGISYQLLKKPQQARKHYQQALQIKKNDFHSIFRLGVYYFNKKNKQQAVKQYLKVLQLSVNHPRSNLQLGKHYLQQQMIEKAFQHLKQAKNANPKSCDCLFYMGRCFLKKNQFQEAIKCFEEIIKMHLNYAQAYTFQGLCYFKMNKKQQAFKLYQTCIKINPKLSINYYHLGLYYYDKGQKNEAKRSYKKALEYNQNHFQSLKQLGKCYYNLQQYYKSIQINKKTIAVNPKCHQAYHLLGKCFYKTKQKYDKHEQAINNILKKENNQAEENFKKAIQFHPGQNPLYLTDYANFLLTVNKKLDAVILFKQAQKLMKDKQLLKRLNFTQEQVKFMYKSIQYKKLFIKVQKIKAHQLNPEQNQKVSSLSKQLFANFFQFSTNPQKQNKQTNFLDSLSDQVKKIKSSVQKNWNQLSISSTQLKFNSTVDNLSKTIQQSNGKVDLSKINKQQIALLKKSITKNDHLYDVLNALKKKNPVAHHYLKHLNWMLMQQLQLYIYLNTGLIKKGQNVFKSQIGNAAHTIGKMTGFMNDVPLIGGVCGTLSKVASFYSDMQQDIFIKKISMKVTNQYYDFHQIQSAVVIGLVKLCTTQKYLDSITSQKVNKSMWDKIKQKMKNEQVKLEDFIVNADGGKQINQLVVEDAGKIVAELLKLNDYDFLIQQSILKVYDNYDTYQHCEINGHQCTCSCQIW